MRKLVVVALTVLGLAAGASAWWDTWVRAQKSEPLVKAFDAATLTGVKKTVEDKQANAGSGGKVAYVAPGENLTFEMDLKHSDYSVWFIARAQESDFDQSKSSASVERPYDLGDATVNIKTVQPQVYTTLEVTSPDGSQSKWRAPIAFRNDYRVVNKMYFPLHEDGKCKITVGLDARSKIGLLINRIEMRDMLGFCARRAMKTLRTLGPDAAVPQQSKLAADARAKRSDGIWSRVPDINMMAGDPRFREWHKVIGRDAPGMHADLANLYARAGDPDAGMDAAVFLCAVADKYPCLDNYFYEVGQYSTLNTGNLSWGQRSGKTVYSGWAGGDLTRLATSYDQVFDFIKGNQALADYVHTKILWVKTPTDVVELLDTGILQDGIDCCNRDVIRDDSARARCLQVLGVDLGNRALTAPVFQMARNLIEDPSDNNLSEHSRAGVSYIGSNLYVGYPAELHVAGGFPLQIGDAGDLNRGRVAEPALPSRVYEGFGEAIMEAGENQPNALLKRAFGVYTGIGRGHAHQDTLNIEIFAHGCRLAPDLGGRHEGSFRSSPNMRTNRMHNLVWIDDKEFQNTFPGSTTSGTGWTESFSPEPGCEYTSNFGRATSQRDVTLYQRSTAMIDGAVTAAKADTYLFDVFRVRGGKDHVYCFHGAYADKVIANVPLAPAKEDAVSKWVLASRMDKNPLEAASADPLVMTWPLRPGTQHNYQATAAGAAAAPVGLALTLFGHGADHVYVGGAASQAYPVDMPYLQLYSTGAEGRSSVYPALFEPYAGERFITEAKSLKVTPATDDAERGVAVQVVTKQGRTDTLYSSLQPAVAHTIEGGATVAGEFGMISEDAQGLALADLVGGTELTKGGISIRCDKAAYTANIQAVDYNNRALTLDADLPEAILNKEVALIGNAEHREAWNLGTVGGRKAAVQKRIAYYQSIVESVDPKTGLIATEREPDVYGPDTDFTQGTRLGSEDGSKVWKATYAPQERWMYLGWPNTDLSYPRAVRMEDLPVVDGKHILKLMGSGSATEPADKVILVLEVTRCDPENHTFYFKMPENPDYQNGGWQFANRVLVNADGSKKWWATYPGTVNAWKVEDKAGVTLDSFPADALGKRKVRAYIFGAGDTLSIKTFVHVLRRADGGYEVRANVPCTVTLPGKPPVSIAVKDLVAAGGVFKIQ